jgi:hypothetical protein
MKIDAEQFWREVEDILLTDGLSLNELAKISGLKIQRRQLHAGSIPAPGTHINNILQHLQSDGPAPGAVFIAQNVAG